MISYGSNHWLSDMQFKPIFKILGVLLMLFSGAMLPPLGVALFYEDGGALAFIAAFVMTFLTGVLMWLPNRTTHRELKIRDGFLVAVLFWTVLSSFGSLPFILSNIPGGSLTDAIFEAVSGLTATGTNVITGLDFLPHALSFYRQQLQFLGGMGIIVLAVAILPMLGIGGMSLYKAETPGPVKDNKLTPRIAQTAKALWYIYVGMTVSCIICFRVAGLPWFESVGEAFSIVATGGFALHDSSFMFYNNMNLEIFAIPFMVLSGANFGLHFAFLRFGRIDVYWRDQEFMAYIGILAVVSLIVVFKLYATSTYPDFGTSLLKGVFMTVSLMTTTGMKNADFATWPGFLPYLLMAVALIGGCAASTSGGIKVIRALLLQKQASREITLLIHPKAVLPIKVGDQVLPDRVIQAIWGFMGIFVVFFVVLVLLLTATGLDVVSAFGAAAVCLSNAGAGIAGVANNFDALTTSAKWLLIFTMLAGRLEIFSLLVLFSPAFWRD